MYGEALSDEPREQCQECPEHMSGRLRDSRRLSGFEPLAQLRRVSEARGIGERSELSLRRQLHAARKKGLDTHAAQQRNELRVEAVVDASRGGRCAAVTTT